MKRIYILRHAKSDYPNNVGDFDRPLSDRGLVEAGFIADYMVRNDLIPDLVNCSAANRTQMTFDALKDKSPSSEVQIREDLYLASAGHLYEDLKTTDQSYDSVLYVGHNPGMHNFALFLTGEGQSDHMQELQFKYPTACLTVIETDHDQWQDIQPSANRLIDYQTGKRLKNAA